MTDEALKAKAKARVDDPWKDEDDEWDFAFGYLALTARLAEIEAERDAAWQAIERGWDIEPRTYFEREAPKNGFVYPLAQAMHHLWKRELKERGGKPITPPPSPQADQETR